MVCSRFLHVLQREQNFVEYRGVANAYWRIVIVRHKFAYIVLKILAPDARQMWWLNEASIQNVFGCFKESVPVCASAQLVLSGNNPKKHYVRVCCLFSKACECSKW
jgi:hypothetical protein